MLEENVEQPASLEDVDEASHRGSHAKFERRNLKMFFSEGSEGHVEDVDNPSAAELAD